jgi:hypothetical protein
VTYFKNTVLPIGVVLFSIATFSASALARSVFLNGVDVSSSRSQELRNVQIRINEKGDIFISAPHYQVTEEDFFTPLSRVPSNGTTANVAPGVAEAVNTGTAISPPAMPSPVQPVSQSVPVKASVAPSSPVASGASPDKSGSFSNIGMQKVSPESMPPVLPATPPAK